MPRTSRQIHAPSGSGSDSGPQSVWLSYQKRQLCGLFKAYIVFGTDIEIPLPVPMLSRCIAHNLPLQRYIRAAKPFRFVQRRTTGTSLKKFLFYAFPFRECAAIERYSPEEVIPFGPKQVFSGTLRRCNCKAFNQRNRDARGLSHHQFSSSCEFVGYGYYRRPKRSTV